MVIALPSLITQLNEARERYLDLVSQVQNNSFNKSSDGKPQIIKACTFDCVDYLNKYFKGNKLGLTPGTWGYTLHSQENHISYVGQFNSETRWADAVGSAMAPSTGYISSPHLIRYQDYYRTDYYCEQFYYSGNTKSMIRGYYSWTNFYPVMSI